MATQPTNMNLSAVDAGNTKREEFGALEVTKHAETAAIAVAAQAEAAIKARYAMAIGRPRDMDDARVKILKECQRPTFAAVARYRKPIGKGVVGFSIRFAEAAIRCMTNMLPETTTVYDDPTKRIVRVCVTDLENNVTYSKDIVIEKTVERSSPKDGQQTLGVRTNSQGKKTYIVAATEDDLLNKQAALESKALRQLALRHLPGDILDECERAIAETRANQDAKDPDAARKAISDGFALLGVQPSDLKEYLGHELGTCAPHELSELRDVYATVRDGEATWRDCLAHKLASRGEGAAQAGTKTESLKDRIKTRAGTATTDATDEDAQANLEREIGEWVDAVNDCDSEDALAALATKAEGTPEGSAARASAVSAAFEARSTAFKVAARGGHVKVAR